MAMPMHRDTAREKVVNSQSLQTVSFVSSIPLRAVHDLDSPGIVTGFVCTLQIPVFVGEGRQMFGFLRVHDYMNSVADSVLFKAPAASISHLHDTVLLRNTVSD